MSLSIIILAAGKGTRMYSAKAKVLHEVGGKPMLEHVIKTAQQLNPLDIHVVIGHQAESIKERLSSAEVQWVLQEEQLGTGHAVKQAIDHVKGEKVLVLYGDVPLTSQVTLTDFLTASENHQLGILTVKLTDPSGYGRIVRGSDHEILSITEEKDADDKTLSIQEGNSGILCANTSRIKHWLNELNNNNEQGEYYLTDCVAAAVNENIKVAGICIENEIEVLGINNQLQLETMEREYQKRKAEALMLQGVTIKDKNRIDIRGELQCGEDVVIDVNCVFEGDVHLGNNVSIGPNCQIKDCEISDNTTILASCVLENSMVADSCSLGPFSRLRPGANMQTGSKAGNFVEIKNANIGTGSKVNHLSYIGDTDMAEQVNIGAGTITCNYDGANKHRTIIGDRAFIGSNTALVAPVEVEADATIGAGSTITKNAPQGELTIERSKQITIKGWIRPVKEKK